MQYTIYERRLIINELCVLFVADGVKRRLPRTVLLERKARET
jgi:hypothetical protein